MKAETEPLHSMVVVTHFECGRRKHSFHYVFDADDKKILRRYLKDKARLGYGIAHIEWNGVYYDVDVRRVRPYPWEVRE